MGDRQGNQGADPPGNRPDGVGRDLVQQVPCEARIRFSPAERPVRDHARPSGSLRGEPSGVQVSRRGSEDGIQDARPGHRDRRRPSESKPSLPADHFGNAGGWYFEIAQGRDSRAVEPDRERKSSGSERTFPEDLTDPARIEAGVIAMADEVWGWCEKANSRGRTVTVKVKWANFQITTSSRSLEAAIETKDRFRGRCHGVGGLVAEEHDENQLFRISVPSGDHSPGDLALSPVHA